MVNVKFYLDKADKSKHFPIHLVLRQKDVQVKVSTGEKVLKKDWDAKNQNVKEIEYTHKTINKFLTFLLINLGFRMAVWLNVFAKP